MWNLQITLIKIETSKGKQMWMVERESRDLCHHPSIHSQWMRLDASQFSSYGAVWHFIFFEMWEFQAWDHSTNYDDDDERRSSFKSFFHSFHSLSTLLFWVHAIFWHNFAFILTREDRLLIRFGRHRRCSFFK